jgi:dTDP-4-dehydrorhamnose reductase
MKVLITGGSSLLGRYLALTKPDDISLESTWYTNAVEGVNYHLDVGNKSQLRYVYERVKPDIIIHCAAMGSVDYAEDNFREVAAVNVQGVINVLQAARHYSAKVIHISTNAVYDGDNPPYSQASPQKPVNAYGRIKKMAERAIVDNDVTADGPSWLIVRPFLLYGWPYESGRPNWGTTIVNKLRRHEPLKLVNDVIWQPTYAADVAAFIWRILDYDREAFNVASAQRLTLYEFGLKIAEIFGLDSKLISPVSSNYFPQIAPRPRDTGYDLSKIIEAELGLPSLENGLQRFKDE